MTTCDPSPCIGVLCKPGQLQIVKGKGCEDGGFAPERDCERMQDGTAVLDWEGASGGGGGGEGEKSKNDANNEVPCTLHAVAHDVRAAGVGHEIPERGAGGGGPRQAVGGRGRGRVKQVHARCANATAQTRRKSSDPDPQPQLVAVCPSEAMVLQEGLQHAARLHTYTHDFRRRRVTVGWQLAGETRAVLRCILLPDLNANLLPLARARGRESDAVAVAVLQFIPAQKITKRQV